MSAAAYRVLAFLLFVGAAVAAFWPVRVHVLGISADCGTVLAVVLASKVPAQCRSAAYSPALVGVALVVAAVVVATLATFAAERERRARRRVEQERKYGHHLPPRPPRGG